MYFLMWMLSSLFMKFVICRLMKCNKNHARNLYYTCLKFSSILSVSCPAVSCWPVCNKVINRVRLSKLLHKMLYFVYPICPAKSIFLQYYAFLYIKELKTLIFILMYLKNI